MIKQFCLCLIAFSLFAIQPIKAQSTLEYVQKLVDKKMQDNAQKTEDLFIQMLNEYRACVEKRQHDNALKIIADCASIANENYYLSRETKILCWSLYLDELAKRERGYGGIFKRYNRLTFIIGYKYEGTPKSYGIELLVASSLLVESRYTTSYQKPIYLVNALRILTRLKEMNIPPVAEKEYEPFYKILEVNNFNTERLKLLQYTHKAMEKFSGQEWFNAAYEALAKKEDDGYTHDALYCVQQSEDKNFADAWALHGFMYEYGMAMSKDLDQAVKYYKQASDKGSVWGKIEYANFLIKGDIVEKDYGQALNLLNSVVDESDFLKWGGGYQLGRLYENGWGVEVNREKSMELYTDSYEKCFVRRLKDLSYEGSLRLENKISEEMIDAELAGVDISQMSADELSAIAQRYEHINAKQKATYFELQAAKKGNSYSACKIGMKYFDLSNWKKEAELEYAFKMFEMGSKGYFAPCKYNLAVMYLYGYGTSPNFEKALDLYNKYIEQVSAEGYKEYTENNYLETISGIQYPAKAKKEGIPLKKALNEFNNPTMLYEWARVQEKSLRPEVIIYFYTRAAQKGHPEAAKRLEAFKKKIAEKQKQQ